MEERVMEGEERAVGDWEEGKGEEERGEED